MIIFVSNTFRNAKQTTKVPQKYEQMVFNENVKIHNPRFEYNSKSDHGLWKYLFTVFGF